MGYTDSTPFLGLPIWNDSDYMDNEDWNEAHRKIDEFAENNSQNYSFDELAQLYGVTETYPDSDTGTITATVGSGSPVTATRETVVSEADGVITYVETTTIDDVATVRTWTENDTTASMEVTTGE